jgi:GNAT superfamily N-acetyltransferase
VSVTVRLAEGEADLAAVRGLCWKYRDVLAERTRDLPGLLEYYYAVPVYRALLDALPERHARPRGAIFVAEVGGRVVACGMTLELAPGVTEIKRVYVDVAARGRGIARTLCEAAMAQARADGFRVMKLDTMRRLPEAVRLYEGMGFTPCAPYHDPPREIRDDILFFEHPL